MSDPVLSDPVLSVPAGWTIRDAVAADMAAVTAIYAQDVTQGTGTFELDPPDLGEMIRVAAGEVLSFSQDDIQLHGHAIECRINAEMPEKNFMPSPGTISQTHLPGGNGVRVDTAAYDGFEITPYYDSMIAKVIVLGRDRTEAIAKMRTALEEMVVVGVQTNLDFQYSILENETFCAGQANTSFIERFLAGEV